jgi:hypothetical protein
MESYEGTQIFKPQKGRGKDGKDASVVSKVEQNEKLPTLSFLHTLPATKQAVN